MHVLWKFDREVCTERSCLRCTVAARRPPQLWRYTGLMEKMLRHVDCFIAPSRFTLAKHYELGLNILIKHIPHFVPKSAEENGLDATPRQFASYHPYFLFVGRLEKIKGAQNLIPALEKRPQYNLLIAGDGAYRTALEDLARNTSNIKFLGKLSYEKLKKLYREAIGVIVPSICYETFGLIAIEAFSVKTPVIVNDLGALPEIVQDSGGGFIYNDAKELVIMMDKLVNDSNLRNELGSNGYETYLKRWTEDAHLAQYLSLIREIQERRADKVNPAVKQRVKA
jgi:glycosyltransferase involved in cell wall biosynthesis